jgi:hypothetical protein
MLTLVQTGCEFGVRGGLGHQATDCENVQEPFLCLFLFTMD